MFILSTQTSGADHLYGKTLLTQTSVKYLWRYVIYWLCDQHLLRARSSSYLLVFKTYKNKILKILLTENSKQELIIVNSKY